MTYTVTEAILDNVLRRVADGSDPLGVGTGMARAHSGDRVEEVVTAALSGLTSTQAAAVETALRKEAPADSARIDLATMDILAGLGIDPLAVVWLASVDDGLSVHGTEDLSAVIEFNGEPWGAVTDVGHVAWWSARCTLAVSGLPDTLVTAATGRMLREIVSHPALDAHPMMVREVQLANQAGIARLKCRREMWLLDDLDHGRPRLATHVALVHDLVDAHHRVTGK